MSRVGEDLEIFFSEKAFRCPSPWNPRVPGALGVAEESEPGEEMPVDMGSLASLEAPLSEGVRDVCADALDLKGTRAQVTVISVQVDK